MRYGAFLLLLVCCDAPATHVQTKADAGPDLSWTEVPPDRTPDSFEAPADLAPEAFWECDPTPGNALVSCSGGEVCMTYDWKTAVCKPAGSMYACGCDPGYNCQGGNCLPKNYARICRCGEKDCSPCNPGDKWGVGL